LEKTLLRDHVVFENQVLETVYGTQVQEHFDKNAAMQIVAQDSDSSDYGIHT